jgi:putative membrane protein
MRRQDIVLESIQPGNFIASASYECMTEVQLGRLAVKQGDAEPVRNFAHLLIEDYDRTATDIARIATRKKLPMPDSLDKEHQNIVEQMKEKSGRDFDSAYTSRMMDGQLRAITLFKRGQRIKDPEISALASRALTMLEARVQRTTSLLESIAPPHGIS